MAQREQISDSVRKVNGEVAVGADLDFQRKWWRFERGIWCCFGLLVVAGLSGVLGNSGPLTHGYYRSEDGFFTLEYDRVAHFGTPFRVVLHPGPASIHGDHASVWLGRETVRELGYQRTIPAPLSAALGDDGTTLTFQAAGQHADVVLMFQPAQIGKHRLEISTPGSLPLSAPVLVMP